MPRADLSDTDKAVKEEYEELQNQEKDLKAQLSQIQERMKRHRAYLAEAGLIEKSGRGRPAKSKKGEE
jgi:hypothetical protein